MRHQRDRGPESGAPALIRCPFSALGADAGDGIDQTLLNRYRVLALANEVRPIRGRQR